MARLSATKKYRGTNQSIFQHYIELCNINTQTFEFEGDSKIIDEFGNVISESIKGDKFKIVCRDLTQINGRYYSSICYDTNIGFTLVSNIRKPYINSRQFNKGELAEGLLTIAIATKILKYNLTIEALKYMISNFELITPETLEYSENHVHSVVKLNKNAILNLVDTSTHGNLISIYNSVLSFIQTNYILKFYNDSNISIRSIGFNGDKNVKADILVKSNMNELLISLKCGNTKNLEQAGTSASAFNRVLETFGLFELMSFLVYDKSVRWYFDVFEEVVSKFNEMITYQRHFHLSYGVINSATRHSNSMIHLHLRNDSFGVYDYRNLFIKLNSLDIIARLDTHVKNPKIVFEDVKSKAQLISFYLETRDGGKRLTLHIMKEKLLSELTLVN